MPKAANPAALGPGDHVFLVDGSSFVFRAYFQSINQDAKYNYRSDGLPTGALRLFTTKLYQFIREGAVGIKPTHFALILDKTEQTFRKEIYADYKANRREPPEDLVPQFPLMREAIRAFGLEPIEKEGYEADDIIATYVDEARAAGAEVLIISSDKDLMQLITDRVLFYDFESGAKGRPGYRPERKIDVAGVIEYFGVPPAKVVDVQALVGDTSDNVPGVPGIGVKTASQLITEYGDLETLLARAEEIKQPKRREALIGYAEQARLSKRLVQLDHGVDTGSPLATHRLPEIDPKRLLAFLKAMELTTLTKRVGEAFAVDPATIEADPKLKSAKAPAWTGATGEASPSPLAREGRGGGFGHDEAGLFSNQPPSPTLPRKGGGDDGVVPGTEGAAVPANRVTQGSAAANAVPIDPKAYETVTDLKRLDFWVQEARALGRLAIAAQVSVPDPMRAEVVGLALATAPGKAAYVPLAHKSGNGDLLGGGLVPGQIAFREVFSDNRLGGLLADESILKIGHDVKPLAVILARHGVTLESFDDTMLFAYALDGENSFKMLAEKWLGYTPIDFKDIAGSGRSALTIDRVPLDRATEFSAEDADVALRLWLTLRPRLVAERMVNLYETLERPMVPVLAGMEARGIKVDRQILSRMSGEFSQKLAGFEAEIYEHAGETFNIGSPKQLGDILFGKFNLPGGSKTKTGAWSTGASVLEDLAAEGNLLAARILDWRQLSKLKSTYTDLLPGFIHPETQRVHTSYALASTTTGRLSSSEPNLQNIPVRTEEGRRIRTAFIAEKGMKLLSADYSQIELRLLAHMADIPALRQAFADGLDIHAMTASEMFNVPIEGMPAEVRRRAKAINFGIIYGISAFGLSNQLGISREDAGAYIKKYFERFPGIRGYMDAMKGKVKAEGHVTTLFGRKVHFPQVNSRNPAERAFVERAAINAPLQGSAADIIRRAMIRVEPALKKAGLNARMLLQVHDELIFEVPEDEVEATKPVITAVMEKAAEPAVILDVPLQVDARAAANWDEAH